jgi:hypothetical protein|tara:strand:- start:29 stop:589 length:561 start_codon:yes stop_codon:yes gene_type:complete
MANKDAAFGLRPSGKVGQNRDNQGLSEYNIAASAAAIYQNDPVEMANTGTITVAAATDVLLGSLTGVFFTDATTEKPTFANHLNASNTATDIVGFVSDDPYQRFEIQSAGTPAQTNIGNCADIAYTAGSSPNYVSKVEASGTMAAGAAQLKIIGVSKDPDNNELGSANTNLIVTINEHFLKQTAGI